MSVSLIVLRLEVDDNAIYCPDLCYKAPHFELPVEERDKKSYAEVVDKSTKTKAALQKYSGRRAYTPLTIETYCTEAVQMEDVTDSTLEKGDLSPRSGSEDPNVSTTSTETSPRSGGSTERNTPEHDHLHTSKQREDDRSATTAAATNLPPSVPWTKTKKRSRGGGKTRELSYSEASQDSPEEEDGACSSSRPGSGKTKNKTHSLSTVRFFSGNPAVENTEGIIHLYKHNQMTSLTDDIPRSEVICMLTVPAAMTSQDLLLFVSPVEPWIEHIKIIRDATPNQYMALLTFRSQKYADDFYKNFNNISYNSIESDMCHLAYVAKVETVKASDGAALPVAGLTELPVCPVCLERMDESVDGILTILCNHSFHCCCLAQWGDTTCPVCRYVQTPEAVADNRCFQCDVSQSLWICLICGYVGCGRYEGGHAHSHFLETNHTYSMQLENNRVWDYAGDNYVHRLVQNKGDGKLVQVDEGGNVVEEEKLDSITLEYTYLLTGQLEAQRHHFEEKFKVLETDAQNRAEELETRSKKALEHCTKLEHELSSAQKEKQTCDKKVTQLGTKMSKMCVDLQEEKEMNKSLRQNQSQWQAKVTDLEQQLKTRNKEVEEVQDQLRDVMFYLEAQEKLANNTDVSQEEIQEGQIVVQSAATGGAAVRKGRKKGGR